MPNIETVKQSEEDLEHEENGDSLPLTESESIAEENFSAEDFAREIEATEGKGYKLKFEKMKVGSFDKETGKILFERDGKVEDASKQVEEKNDQEISKDFLKTQRELMLDGKSFSKVLNTQSNEIELIGYVVVGKELFSFVFSKEITDEKFAYASLEDVVKDKAQSGAGWKALGIINTGLKLSKNSENSSAEKNGDKEVWDTLRAQGWAEKTEHDKKTGKLTQKIYFADAKGNISFHVSEYSERNEFVLDLYDSLSDSPDDDILPLQKTQNNNSFTFLDLNNALGFTKNTDNQTQETGAGFWGSLFTPKQEAQNSETNLNILNLFGVSQVKDSEDKESKTKSINSFLTKSLTLQPAFEPAAIPNGTDNLLLPSEEVSSNFSFIELVVTQPNNNESAAIASPPTELMPDVYTTNPEGDFVKTDILDLKVEIKPNEQSSEPETSIIHIKSGEAEQNTEPVILVTDERQNIKQDNSPLIKLEDERNKLPKTVKARNILNSQETSFINTELKEASSQDLDSSASIKNTKPTKKQAPVKTSPTISKTEQGLAEPTIPKAPTPPSEGEKPIISENVGDIKTQEDKATKQDKSLDVIKILPQNNTAEIIADKVVTTESSLTPTREPGITLAKEPAVIKAPTRPKLIKKPSPVITRLTTLLTARRPEIVKIDKAHIKTDAKVKINENPLVLKPVEERKTTEPNLTQKTSNVVQKKNTRTEIPVNLKLQEAQAGTESYIEQAYTKDETATQNEISAGTESVAILKSLGNLRLQKTENLSIASNNSTIRRPSFTTTNKASPITANRLSSRPVITKKPLNIFEISKQSTPTQTYQTPINFTDEPELALNGSSAISLAA